MIYYFGSELDLLFALYSLTPRRLLQGVGGRLVPLPPLIKWLEE